MYIRFLSDDLLPRKLIILEARPVAGVWCVSVEESGLASSNVESFELILSLPIAFVSRHSSITSGRPRDVLLIFFTRRNWFVLVGDRL